MGKKIKALNTVGRILYLIVFAASLAVFWLTRSGEGWIDLILNCIFDAAAIGFILAYFAGSARPLAKMACALDEATDTIRSRTGAGDPAALWKEFGKKGLFGHEKLDEAYGAYVKQVKRESRQNPATVSADLADYISDELVYSTAHKPFSDQIGGIMTGLGILFTFIGLVYGLRSFNATTVELMQSSTQALMAGIKVAFLTSIFGLIYSIIFGLIYKRTLSMALKSVYDFQDCYDELVRPTNGRAGENALIRLQAEQNELLERLADNIGGAVSDSLSASIRPVVEQLRTTLEGYVSVAIDDQRAGLDKVVAYFLQTMNSSMGNIFTQLREQTAELSSWQKTMSGAISKLIDSVAVAEADLEKSRKYTQLIIERVDAFTANADTLTARQLESLKQIEGFMNDYQALHKTERAYITEMAASAKSAQEAAEKNAEAVNAFNTMAVSFTDSLEKKTADMLGALTGQVAVLGEDRRNDAELVHKQLESAGERLIDAADNLRMVADKNATDMTTASEKLTNALGGSFERFDAELTGLTTALGRLTAASTAVSDSLKYLPETATNFDTEIGKANKSLKTELSNLLSALTDTRKALDKFNTAASRKLS